MGNHLSNFCSGTCTCIFPESEELKETHIIQLAEKFLSTKFEIAKSSIS